MRAMVCVGIVAISLALAGWSSAKIDPETCAGMWLFDEGEGEIAKDSSGNGNDGEIFGAKWVDGKFGGALEFDGDDYVNCGNGPSLQIQDEITIVFWFKVEAFQNTWETFLAKGDDSYRASRSAGTGNATHFGLTGTTVGGGNGHFDGTVIVTDGQWHHWAGVYDGSEARIYIDGELDTASPGTGKINISSFDLYIGNNSQWRDRFLHGVLDEVAIFNVALSEEDIKNIATSGLEKALGMTPVSLSDKLATTWASIKAQY